MRIKYVCPECGSENYVEHDTTNQTPIIGYRYECKNCGHWFDELLCMGVNETTEELPNELIINGVKYIKVEE